MSAQSTTTKPKYAEEKAQGQVVPFEKIEEQGAYVCNWSGHLLRIPEDAVCSGRSPLITINGSETLFVTKISDNPFLTLTKARLIACNLDVAVNF
jgi:hypothetical protein